MAAYIIRRLLWLGVTLLFISLVTFVLMHSVNGGPWDEERNVPESQIENLNRKYGLDEPLWRQYTLFLENAVQGDLGLSFQRQDRPVTEIILNGFKVTAVLGVLSFGLSSAVGVTLGVFSALNRNRLPDYGSVFAATMGAAVPAFVLGIFLKSIFAVELGWFATFGWDTRNGLVPGWLPRWDQLVLPVVTLSTLPAAYLARITRASLLDVLRQDYMRTARAKGLAPRAVLFRHGMRNAAIPILTLMGPILAALVTGSFVVEQVFSVPGIGRAFVTSVSERDYGVIMGTTLFYALIIVLANLAVDIAYACADPPDPLSMSEQTATSGVGVLFADELPSARGYWSRAWSRLLRNRVAVIALGLIGLMAVVALLAPWIAPQDPMAQDVLNSREAPSWSHLAGTDSLGRDLLSRLIYGARVSLAVGILAQLVVVGIGLPLGLIAGFRGSWSDTLIMRITDLTYAFPDLLLIILLRALLGGNIFTLFLIIGLVSWVDIARLVRGQTLSLREREFVVAARSLGASDREIMTRHLLPNLTGPLVVLLAIGVPRAIFIEAALSFIGFGVDPTTPSWGTMVQEGQSALVGSGAHVAIFPAAAIALLTLAFTFLGDGLRDALDPDVEEKVRPSAAAETKGRDHKDGVQELPRAA